jgi:Ran GTPase-activating protein 1
MTTIHSRDLGILDEHTFSIKNKGLKFDSYDDIKPYLDELSKLSDVAKIDISGNTISPECSKSLAEIFLKFKDTLKDINLQDIYTSRDKFEIPKSLSEFFPILLQLPNLSVLNLSDNAFGQDTIEILEDFISKTKTIEYFIISNNGLGPFSGARIGKALYKSGKLRDFNPENSKSLKAFWCGRNRLENGSCEALSLGFKANKNLQEIKLYQNGIRPSGISKLINFGLSNLNELTILDLQDNTFTLPGSFALAENIKSWPNLIELNINDCLLKSKGCKLFLDKLAEISDISKLQILRLQYNELEIDSLELLSNFVKNLNDLSALELNGNRFEEDSEFIEKINEIFEEKGLGELDDLDDLEEPDSEEEEDDDEDDDDKEEAEPIEEIDARLKELEKELSETHL